MSSVETGFADVNGTRLYYEVAGSGHPVVLVHGSHTDTRMWDDQFEPFAQHYRVIRYDMRGYGKSAFPGEETYLHEEDLSALLEFLRVERAHLVGLSAGAGTVMEFALRYPHRTGRLILVSVPLSGLREGSSIRKIDERMVAAFRMSGKMAATELAYEHPVFKPAIQNPRCSARMKQYLDEADFWRMAKTDPLGGEGPLLIERLGGITATTLVIIGDLDIPEVVPSADAISYRAARARKVMLPGCGHMVNMEDPETFNRIALDFLAGG